MFPSRWPAPWAWWAAAAGLSLLTASQWLHAPSVEYLVPLIVATAVTVVTSMRIRGPARRWALAAFWALIAVVLISIAAQRELWTIAHDWDAARSDESSRGLTALQHALDDATRDAGRRASEALAVSAERDVAFDQMRRIARGLDDGGVILYRGDTAFAWSGDFRAPIDQVQEGTTIVATPFYLALQVTQRRGYDRAAVAILLDAAPPADRFVSTFAQPIADRAGLKEFKFLQPSDTAVSPDLLRYVTGHLRLFDVAAVTLTQGEVAQRIQEVARARAGIALAIALVCFVIGVWRATKTNSRRAAALAVGLACVGLVPLNQYSNLSRLFDPSVYFMARGGPLTGNAAALAMTGAIVLLGVLAVFRRRGRRMSRWAAVVTTLAVAVLGPFLLRDLARGVHTPLRGVDTSLWLVWQVPLFLAAVSVLLSGAAAGAIVLGPRRGAPPWVAPTAAIVAAVLGPVVWEAPGRWPWWYSILWIVAIGLLALSRRSRRVILSASTVAALGATTLVWGRTARGRVEAAEHDLASLGQPDSVAATLLQRFGLSLAGQAPPTRESLLENYVTSDIAAAGNPIILSAWPTDTGAVATFATADIPNPVPEVARVVATARRTGQVIIEPVATDTAVQLVMGAPSAEGGATGVVLAPPSRLFLSNPFAQLLGLSEDRDVEPLYSVRLRGPLLPRRDTTPGPTKWRRDGTQLHGDRIVATGRGATPAHVDVELRSLDALVERGALIVLLNLALVGALWLAAVIADGGAGRWLRARRRTLGRSYRTRLSLALFAFFVIPGLGFAVWMYGQLASDAVQSRAVLVGETLRSIEPTANSLSRLSEQAERLETPLFVFRGGELRQTSDQLYDDLAPTGRLLPPSIERTLTVHAEENATEIESVGDSPTLFGYRSLTEIPPPPAVIAAPARATDAPLGRRRRDLGVLVLFATALGALAALWLSGLAARQLAKPIGSLREAALALAGGSRTAPLETEPTIEFLPVFAAFRRMTADLNASRSALEEAQRRTAAVLRNVASGVVAVDRERRITLANPRSEQLLGVSLPPGAHLDETVNAEVAHRVDEFMKGAADELDFEATVEQRQLRGTLTRLSRGGGGIVITVDDVSEIARAQRVIAWGEMARQVAHEIKNPLTPIRLGVQHLRRARADKRVDFDRVLDHNVNQILAEIDRLDEIARAFSRYGAAPDERARPSEVDIAAIVREVVSLERMGGEGGEGDEVEWVETGDDSRVTALARVDELKEVLLNVLENARLAGAARVLVSVTPPGDNGDADHATITVSDDGLGISADVLPRIFEPHFSTRTSGSGLGLAISRQLVEGWGGSITVHSPSVEPPTDGRRGATVTIALRAAAEGASTP
ncbi:MAG TPA: ATP-binding protein [Gemmatimonadaceae bacterium]|nr:ATP-binding protein [Gemmatimonadaceae bacterium]